MVPQEPFGKRRVSNTGLASSKASWNLRASSLTETRPGCRGALVSGVGLTGEDTVTALPAGMVSGGVCAPAFRLGLPSLMSNGGNTASVSGGVWVGACEVGEHSAALKVSPALVDSCDRPLVVLLAVLLAGVPAPRPTVLALSLGALVDESASMRCVDSGRASRTEEPVSSRKLGEWTWFGVHRVAPLSVLGSAPSRLFESCTTERRSRCGRIPEAVLVTLDVIVALLVVL